MFDMSSITRDGLPPISTIWAFVVLFVAYAVWNVIYTFTLHPLAKFPGPWWLAVSRIPYWAVAISGEQHRFMKGLHETYGPVLRFSPNELSYTDPQAWKDICGVKGSRPENGKAAEAQYVNSNPISRLEKSTQASRRKGV